MEIAGYIASVFIGIILGFIGGGGSILTIPVLVYLMSVDKVSATAYSLFIVGITSAIGSYSYFKHKQVSLRTAAVFGMPSIVSVFLTRAYILPAIPHHITNLGGFELTKGTLLMVLFALIMLAASFSMIRKDCCMTFSQKMGKGNHYPLVMLEGVLVGMLTGLVGAGGGFLIIPSLVVFSNLDIKRAVGTSLLIITANSLIGFVGGHGHAHIDWPLLLSVTALSVLGILLGMTLNGKIEGSKLKPAFGWFVMVMGAFILLKETVFS
jgi:uncharacterized protein